MSFDIMELDIDEAKEVANSLVDVLFLNDQYCGFRQIYKDTSDFCKDGCDLDSALANLQKHAFDIVTKLSVVMEIFTRKEGNKQISYIFESAEAVGEGLGEVASGLIGFEK